MDIAEFEEADVLSSTLCESDFLFGDNERPKSIGGCEISPTDKARCIICKDRIPQGTPRAWVMGKYKQPPPDEGIINIKRFICYNCSLEFLSKRKRKATEIIMNAESAKEQLGLIIPTEEKFIKLMNDDNVKKRVKADIMLKEINKESE